MRRFPQLAFGALVVATVAAFFITQHLKTTTPLLASPRLDPFAINPAGGPCRVGQHRVAMFSFYALHNADTATVRIIDAAGRPVRTLARARRLRIGVRTPDGQFSWDGRDAAGHQVRDGRYTIEVRLATARRTLTLSSPAGPRYISVITTVPTASVTSVAPATVAPGGGPVRIALAQSGAAAPQSDGGVSRGVAHIDVYAFDRAGAPHLVDRFRVARLATSTTWNLRYAGHPAPPGRYLIGIDALDPACNAARFPSALPARLGPRELPPIPLGRAVVTIRP